VNEGLASRRHEPAPAEILVVEDEVPMLRVLGLALAEHGYALLEATTGSQGLALAFDRQPSLVLLDLGLPDVDGVQVAQHIREFSRVPIIVLSARSAEADIVEALDRGATDYVTKPFREAELLARIRACLRTSEPLRQSDYQFGDICIEPLRRRVTVQNRHVKLSATEYKLLTVLVRAGGAVVTHHQLLREVWGAAYVAEVRYLRVYMHHLREKLEPEPAQPRYLLTEAGIGYRLCATAPS
jgi:two-component system KDP operon response regulator KdpE